MTRAEIGSAPFKITRSADKFQALVPSRRESTSDCPKFGQAVTVAPRA